MACVECGFDGNGNKDNKSVLEVNWEQTMHNLSGKGVYITPQLKSVEGYSYIVIDLTYDIDISEYLAILHSYGVKVLASLGGESIKQILSALDNNDFDGLVLSSDCDRATALRSMKRIRDEYPDLFIGFTAYRFPSLKDFPYFNFLARCDAVMPYFDTSKVKEPVRQMRRILKEWRSITNKQIVPIIKPGENIDLLVEYLKGEKVDSVCFASPNGIRWGESERYLFSGRVKGTSWLSVHRKPSPDDIVTYYQAGDEVKVLEIECENLWARSEKGWCKVIGNSKRFLDF